MIFCGDIALPFKGAVRLEGVPERLAQACWVGNLEGSLIDAERPGYAHVAQEAKVFNTVEAIKALKETIGLQVCNLANNHVLDAAGMRVSKPLLKQLGLEHIGAGETLEEAQKAVVVRDGDVSYVLVGFGWDGISCIYADGKREGVNPYTRRNAEEVVKRLVRTYPECRVVPLMHWNYETEKIPQPMDRAVAHKLIDMGAWAVIGCHAHRVQPTEVYKGRLIVYGMGNFMFRQGVYHNGRLRFAGFCRQELIVELTKEAVRLHWLAYDSDRHVVTYQRETTPEQAEFANLQGKKYVDYFMKNRRHRGLPVFFEDDDDVAVSRKIRYLKHRQKVVGFIAKNEWLKKFAKRILGK